MKRFEILFAMLIGAIVLAVFIRYLDDILALARTTAHHQQYSAVNSARNLHEAGRRINPDTGKPPSPTDVSNPVQWLERKPANYTGDYDPRHPQAGWSYDQQQQRLRLTLRREEPQIAGMPDCQDAPATHGQECQQYLPVTQETKP